MPGTGRHRDRAVGGDLDRRLDQVGIEVALARGDVAGQREVRQRRQVDVRGAADARLEHAAVPHRDAVRGAQIVQPDRLGEAADAARLDVDDAAGAGGDRLARDADRLDRLVEADRRRQPPLQRRVIARCRRSRAAARSSSGRTRSSSREMVRVARACTPRSRRPSAGSRRSARARSRPASTIPARLDLDLDPLIAGRELALHLRRRARRAIGWMPIDTPEAMRSRVPPRTRLSGSPRCRANRSHAAISTAAFAMLWPRIALSAGKTSRGCANVDAEHARRDEVAMMCHAVSLVSEL